jgi:inner membrane protein
MTDAAASPPPNAASRGTHVFRLFRDYLAEHGLVGRALMLAVLTLLLRIPLGMVDGVITDRQSHQSDAIDNVRNSWGRAQTFVGPMIVMPYSAAIGAWMRAATLLPEKLTIDGKLAPEQRRRGLFSVTVYTATFDVVAEFQTKAVRELLADGRWIDWSAARLTLGLSDVKSINASVVEVDGQPVDWIPDTATDLSSLQAPLKSAGLADRDTVTVRFHVTFSGSGALCLVPLGRRTEASLASSWPSPSFMGRYLPTAQTVDTDGFRAKWSISYLGRGYGQLWDGASSTDPAARAVLESAFGVTLLNAVDA